MIIRFPTALYQPVLPSFDEAGNITFTISSNDPLRLNITPYPLQRGATNLPIPPKTYTKEQRREFLGDLVFSLSSGASYSVNDGKLAYEVGQVLEFADEVEPEALTAISAPDLVELQQNTNKLDLTAAGLSQEDSDRLLENARKQFEVVSDTLSSTRTQISMTQSKIQDNQKLINEVIKIKNSASAMFPPEDPMIIKLEEKLTQLNIDKINLSNEYNGLVDKANSLYNELLSIKEVVR